MAPISQVHFELNGIEVHLNGMIGSVPQKHFNRQNSHIQRIRFAKFVLAALLIRPRIGHDRQSIMIIVRQRGSRVRRSLLRLACVGVVLLTRASDARADANHNGKRQGSI